MIDYAKINTTYKTVDHLNTISALNHTKTQHRSMIEIVNRIINLPNATDEYKITNLKKYMSKYLVSKEDL